MPRKIFESLVSRALGDIRSGYPVGSRYRTVREMTDQFQVSLQTAHRCVTHLAEIGVLRRGGRRGLFVASHVVSGVLVGKRILLVSANPDPRFNKAFLLGLQDAADGLGVKIVLRVLGNEAIGSLDFGRKLQQIVAEERAAGVVAVYFRGAELAFYHLQTQGIDIVSDIAHDNLPTLPAVQTDNARHARKAARLMHGLAKKEVVAASFWPENNRRYVVFRDELKQLSPKTVVRYIRLSEPDSMAHLHVFFDSFDGSKAVFSVDYAANHVLAPYFALHDVPVKDNFIVYDSEADFFLHKGNDPAPAVAPSLRELGKRLAEKLFHKIETGEWSRPFVEFL